MGLYNLISRARTLRSLLIDPEIKVQIVAFFTRHHPHHHGDSK